MRSCVVLGSGRSGTSMLGGMLHSAGYHMGNELLPATSSNPRGYFEDRAVNELNEDLLVQLHPARPLGKKGLLYPRRLSYGHHWLAVLDTRTAVPRTPQIDERIARLASTRPFCLKDPRFCYTLEAWREALGDAAFICVFREPGRTAASMIIDSRQQPYLRGLRMTRRRALRVWTSMYEHVLEKHRHEGDWLFVHYDQILDGSAIGAIESVVETGVDASFVDAKLKRSRDSGRIPVRTAALYERLCSLAGVSRS